MIPVLQGFAAAVLADGDAAAVAGDLVALEAALVAEPLLAATLTDTGLQASVRRGVAADLLTAKLTPAALRLVLEATVAAPAQEFPVAITWLANRARGYAAGNRFDEEPLSAIAARRRVGGFAAALFATASTDDLGTIGAELFQIARLVATNAAIRGVVGDRDVPAEARSSFLANLLAGKVHPVTAAVAAYVPVGGRPRDVVGTLDYLVVHAAQHRGWRVARVQAGAPLDDAQRLALAQSLEQLAHHPVELNVTVDEALLAGVIVEIGDLRLDDSLRGRLEVLREHVAASKQQFVSHFTTNEGAS